MWTLPSPWVVTAQCCKRHSMISHTPSCMPSIPYAMFSILTCYGVALASSHPCTALPSSCWCLHCNSWWIGMASSALLYYTEWSLYVWRCSGSVVAVTAPACAAPCGCCRHLASLFEDDVPLPPVMCFAMGTLGFLTPFDASQYRSALGLSSSVQVTQCLGFSSFQHSAAPALRYFTHALACRVFQCWLLHMVLLSCHTLCFLYMTHCDAVMWNGSGHCCPGLSTAAQACCMACLHVAFHPLGQLWVWCVPAGPAWRVCWKPTGSLCIAHCARVSDVR